MSECLTVEYRRSTEPYVCDDKKYCNYELNKAKRKTSRSSIRDCRSMRLYRKKDIVFRILRKNPITIKLNKRKSILTLRKQRMERKTSFY